MMLVNSKIISPTSARFINKVLQLLDKRYHEAKGGQIFYLPETRTTKKFSERELTEVSGINWPALKDGRRRTLPSRELVMVIADYLECSLNERNELLAAADYAPVEAVLSGPELEEALKPCRVTLYKYLAYPAFIVNRDWNILDLNPAAASFFEIAATDLQIAAAPPNLLYLVFDPAGFLRSRLEATDPQYWRELAQFELLAFRLENRWCTQELWYKRLIKDLEQFPDFAAIFAATDPLDHSDNNGSQYIFRFRRLAGEAVRVRAMFVRPGNASYPQIILCVPDDRATEQVYAQLGFNLPSWHDKYIVV